jgi:hypothetical protein
LDSKRLDALKQAMNFLQNLMPGGLLGQGMAQQANQAIQSRPYQMYAKEMQALGQPAIPYEQWMQMMQQQQQPKGLLGR